MKRKEENFYYGMQKSVNKNKRFIKKDRKNKTNK